MVKKNVVIIVLLIAAIVLAAVSFGLFKNPRQTITLENPARGLTMEQAVEQFDEDFVIFLLYAIGANELHNPPFSSNRPQIQFYIGEDAYAATVEKGGIGVGKGVIDDHDIIIRTSKEEAVKMVMDSGYVIESFNSGGSSVELVAGKPELLLKGYLGLYDKLKPQ